FFPKVILSSETAPLRQRSRSSAGQQTAHDRSGGAIWADSTTTDCCTWSAGATTLSRYAAIWLSRRKWSRHCDAYLLSKMPLCWLGKQTQAQCWSDTLP